MTLRSCCYALLLLLAGGTWITASLGQEPGSFRLNLKSGRIADGKRDYAAADAVEVLKRVIIDWMTNPEVKDAPYGYLIDPNDERGQGAKPKLERFLIDERYVPKGFDVRIPGVKVELFDRSKRDLKQGEMCIRIDRFDPKQDDSIDVEFLHSGYGIIGGAWTTYQTRKDNGKWTVEYLGSFDP